MRAEPEVRDYLQRVLSLDARIHAEEIVAQRRAFLGAEPKGSPVCRGPQSEATLEELRDKMWTMDSAEFGQALAEVDLDAFPGAHQWASRLRRAYGLREQFALAESDAIAPQPMLDGLRRVATAAPHLVAAERSAAIAALAAVEASDVRQGVRRIGIRGPELAKLDEVYLARLRHLGKPVLPSAPIVPAVRRVARTRTSDSSIGCLWVVVMYFLVRALMTLARGSGY